MIQIIASIASLLTFTTEQDSLVQRYNSSSLHSSWRTLGLFPVVDNKAIFKVHIQVFVRTYLFISLGNRTAKSYVSMFKSARNWQTVLPSVHTLPIPTGSVDCSLSTSSQHCSLKRQLDCLCTFLEKWLVVYIQVYFLILSHLMSISILFYTTTLSWLLWPCDNSWDQVAENPTFIFPFKDCLARDAWVAVG